MRGVRRARPPVDDQSGVSLESESRGEGRGAMTTVPDPSVRDRLEHLVLAACTLHSRSGIAQELLALSEEQEAANERLARLVAADNALARRVRRVATIEAAALAHPLPTIRHAADALGFRAVHSTALACSFIAMLNGECRNLHYITFWRHSVPVAMLAQVLASVEKQHRDHAFAAGLLHNIGLLTLDLLAPAVLEAACKDAGAERLPLAEALHALTGFSDVELGAAVVGRWELPEAIVSAVAGWRRDTSLKGDELSGLVARAAAYAARAGLSDGAETLRYAPEAVTEPLAPLDTAMKQIGGLDWLQSRVDTILEAAVLA